MRILVADRPYIGYDIDYSPLARHGELHFAQHDGPEELRETLAGLAPELVVANRPRFDAALLEAWAGSAPSRAPGGRRLICLTATGTNTVDLAAARLLGIGVCNVRGYSTDSVAQHCFALALHLNNRTARFDREARLWPKAAPGGPWTPLGLRFHELAGRRWGIIGMGTIGRKVAAIAQAFGCVPAWCSVSGSRREEAWPRLELADLLAQSDIVSIHSPLNAQSRGLLGAAELALMRPGSLLLNLGRGGIIDEDALAAALSRDDAESGRPGLAGLDVLAPEPPEGDNPLFGVPSERLLITPHVGWAAVEARQRVIEECGLNITAWLAGEMRNRVEIAP